MEGYGPSSYGDAMADVYDDWYGDLPQLDAAVERLAALAAGGPVLELGVGTGRLALPLAARGLAVSGVDASAAMVERLRAKPGGETIATTVGDMAAAEPSGPFSLVFAAVNTFFGLDSEAAQRACFASVAGRLLPGGRFVVEAFVPEPGVGPLDRITIRDLTAERVVLSVSRADPARQIAEGHYVELRDGAPPRLRPWRIRWADVGQLDDYAAAAGLGLEARWASWDGEAFGADSVQHVSVWRRPPKT